MGCEELIFPDWSPTDNPIQSERAKRASSSIMESEEFILPDWSQPDNPARPCRPKAGYGLVMMMMIVVTIVIACTAADGSLTARTWLDTIMAW